MAFVTSRSNTVLPPTRASGSRPAARSGARPSAPRPTRRARRASRRQAIASRRALRTGRSTCATPGTAASRRASVCGSLRRQHVRRSAEARSGQLVCALGRNTHLGAAWKLVEPAVERLHPQERDGKHEHQARPGCEAEQRAAHHTRAPSRSRRRRSRPRVVRHGSRSRQAVDCRVPGRGEERRQERDRREHGDADDDDRTDGHRAQRIHVDREERRRGTRRPFAPLKTTAVPELESARSSASSRGDPRCSSRRKRLTMKSE